MRYALLYVSMLFGASLCFGADVYPSKPVRVIVPYPPGGVTDFTGRVISQQLAEQLGKPFIVDNRVGAGGIVGNGIAAKSPPDGYTLSIADPSFTIVPGLKKSLPYDALKDFTPITQISRNAEVLVVSPTLNVNTLKEFVALAQANPGKLNYASGGTGTIGHLMFELFKITAKINIVHIPYNGSGAAATALLGDLVQTQITVIPSVLALVKSGKMRALAVTTSGKRTQELPDVPSMSEAGVSGMTGYSWAGLVGPAGMPKEVVNKLHSEVIKALEVPSVKEKFSAQYAELVASRPEEFSLYIRDELRRWAEVIKSAGITSE